MPTPPDSAPSGSSLWELMQAFSVTHLLMLHSIMENYTHFYEHPIYRSRIGQFLFNKNVWSNNKAVIPADRESLGRFYVAAVREAMEMGLTTSVATLKKIQQTLVDSRSTYHDLWKHGDELSARLRDEMDGRFFLSLSLIETDYYANYRQKWNDVIQRFPNTEDDIDVAGKCFALSRYSAAVFHSLQIIEIGLIELGRVLVVKDPLPGWSATTNRLKGILRIKYQDRTAFQQKHSALLEQLDMLTEALKSAWRNKVSHAHGRLTLLTTGFAPDVAEEILIASRGFMRRLAIDVPTAPDPDA